MDAADNTIPQHDTPTPDDPAPDARKNTPPANDPVDETQEEINHRQMGEIARQLNLGDGGMWGLDELARALAVFELDFTSLNAPPTLLLNFIRDSAANTLQSGTEDAARVENAFLRLSGALSGSAGMMAMLTADSSMRVDVVVDGFSVNAGAIMALSNFMMFSQ